MLKKYLSILFKGLRKLYCMSLLLYYNPLAKIILYLNGVNFSSSIKVNGIIKVVVTRRGSFKIGRNVKINSGNMPNLGAGRNQKSSFFVEGDLFIGENTGMSATAILCHHSIEIGKNVNLGSNTVIFDTDFHSLDPKMRQDKLKDKENTKKKKVVIKDNVFIGSHSTILKGVTIGENSVIGACSLVSRNIPKNQIWGGNPIKFIREVEINKPHGE
jgi:acetyltransferase-like isoleucine patch superfamily enzyme